MIRDIKHRYIMIETSEPIDMDARENQEALETELLKQLGELKFYEANPKFALQLSGTVFVLKTNRHYDRSTILATAFIKKMLGREIGLYTIKTSGTIRSLKSTFRKIYRQT